MVEASSFYRQAEGSRGEHHPAFCSVVLGVSVLRLYYWGPLSICWLDGPRGNWLRRLESQDCLTCTPKSSLNTQEQTLSYDIIKAKEENAPSID